jgi:hypothetical protein
MNCLFIHNPHIPCHSSHLYKSVPKRKLVPKFKKNIFSR